MRLLQDLPEHPRAGAPWAIYDKRVRDLVLGRLIEDGMSIEQTLESLSREDLLELSTRFVYDVLATMRDDSRWPKHRRKVLALFSGTLCETREQHRVA